MDKISLMFKALRVEERVHTLGSGYVTSLGAEVPFFPCGSPGLLLAAFAVCLQGWWGAAFEDPRCGRCARGFSLVFLYRFCSRIRLLCPPNPPVCSPAQGLECQWSVPVPCPALPLLLTQRTLQAALQECSLTCCFAHTNRGTAAIYGLLLG